MPCNVHFLLLTFEAFLVHDEGVVFRGLGEAEKLAPARKWDHRMCT